MKRSLQRIETFGEVRSAHQRLNDHGMLESFLQHALNAAILVAHLMG